MEDVRMQEWPKVWAEWREVLNSRGAVVQALEIAPPALETEVRATERRLGRPIPSALRDALLGFSAHVHFMWYLDDGPAEPRALKNLSRFGELEWSCATLERYRTEHDDLSADIEMYGQEGATLLTETIVFQVVANGDALAVDCRSGAVVYLDHEGGPGNGVVLAPSFSDFVNRYSAIGCSGPDWDVLEPICDSRGIDPETRFAQQWRAWVGFAA
jgi:hypothetical protein